MVLVRNEVKKENSKRTVLQETFHEMRKEIAERSRKRHEMSREATARREKMKRGRECK